MPAVLRPADAMCPVLSPSRLPMRGLWPPAVRWRRYGAPAAGSEDRAAREAEGGMAQAASARGVCGAVRGTDGTRVLESPRQGEAPRHVHLRRVLPAALHVHGEVRQRHRLAQLL